MQLLGGGRDVETALGDGGEITQLMQFHAAKNSEVPACYQPVSGL
jgi:hypothetical protein